MYETFRLPHEQYSNITTNTFKDLLVESQFTDVTLACEDGNQIEAHKVILSSSSTFFRNVFVKNTQHQHMLLYLKGIYFEDLQAIVSFIYMGETQVRSANLDRFGLAVKDLQIDSLLNTETVMYPPDNTVDGKKEAVEINDALDFIASQTYTTVTIDEDESDKSNEINFVSVDEDLFDDTKPTHENEYNCTKCEFKSDLKSSLERHRINVHSGVKGYTCDVCKLNFRSWTILKKHKLSKH